VFRYGVHPIHTGFQCEGGAERMLNGLADTLDTPFGPYLIAVCGYGTARSDVWSDFLNYLNLNVEFELRATLVLMAICWIAVRRGLAPLREASRQAQRLDVTSLDQRIACEDMPVEIMPLITTINEALSRLDEGVSRQTRFLANAAHELRTPIMILSARASGPEQPTFRRDIQRDVRRIRSIVEQLLAFARVDRQGRAHEEEVDLGALALAIVNDFALLAIKSGKAIEFDGCDRPVFISGDSHALQSVIANLIDNALRAEPQGGAVIVRLCEDATLCIVDHGEGVKREERELVFEPFWRKSQATPGSGLGLAIARELLEKLGGRIWVEDTPGGGATFKLSFARRA